MKGFAIFCHRREYLPLLRDRAAMTGRAEPGNDAMPLLARDGGRHALGTAAHLTRCTPYELLVMPHIRR